MSDVPPVSFEDEAFLTLRVSGGPQTLERLLLVGRPQHGQVRVREWTTDTLNSAGHEYEVDAAELLASLTAAAKSGSSLGTELYRVQLWLNG